MFFEARGVSKLFGGLLALDNIDLTINQGEIVGLIGPNGAGKTTFFNVVTGVYPPDKGEIFFNDLRIDRIPAHKIIASGIARTFQNIRLFANMTALENIMLGRHCRTGAEVWESLAHTPGFRQEEREIQQRAKEFLNFVGLLALGNELW